MLRRTNKNKKYALRKIGKYFGPCVIGTMIAVGVAATIPLNEVHATTPPYMPMKVYDVTITPETVYKADDSKDVGYRKEEKGTPGKQEIWTKFEKRDYFEDKYPGRNVTEMLGELYSRNQDKTLDEDGTVPAHPDWAESYNDNNGKEFPKRIDEDNNGEFRDKDIYDKDLGRNTVSAERKVESNKKFVALTNTTADPDNPDESTMIDYDDNEVVADYDSDNKVVRLNPHYYEIKNEEDKVDTVITVGTKPTVVTEEIPYTTRYVIDDTKGEDYCEVTTPGEKGEETTTTTYSLDTTNGTVTSKSKTVITKQAVNEVITLGAQPNRNVPLPTIAIVEESNNKASIEVKAPKKDADTVRITYPKRDGSGNEVLTLTKQSGGEWTLDKQPENVTLDKKKGIVTIPREAIVNKQKVQARSKNGNSGFSLPVYEVLSIAEAKPVGLVTRWVAQIDNNKLKTLRDEVNGKEPAGEFEGYKWVSSRLEDGILTHKFEEINNGNSQSSNLIPEKPSSKTENPVIRTVWRDENGKDLKTPSVEKQEAGEVEGYEFVESHREGDNLTVHVFRTKKSQTPSPAPAKVSEQKGEAVATSEKPVENGISTNKSDKAELPNTGTETNASLASAGILTLLAGLGLGFFKKKEDEN
ncbi:G5 domain-containing protein [Streptococcus sp. SPS1]|uniref:G5 domain-containing protein n=1 Tax=Streptococcus sp. SPS1 TaxID=3018247 RepID=UPI00263D1E4D|nr:G5 domain-containing protein [Streptococcus sp. SPS1]MDN5026430.1 G5 domain-containing protein [Streptococcus sp. SPS1]